MNQTEADARRHAERATIAVLNKLRESAAADGRTAITIHDIDRVVERLAAEREAAIEIESRRPNCRRVAPPVPEIDQRTAGVVTDREGRIIGEIARLVPGANRWGIRFIADAQPPVPTETHGGVRWWADIAGVLAADDPADLRSQYSGAVADDSTEVRDEL